MAKRISRRIFDAGGSCSDSTLRGNTDGVLLHWTRKSLDMLGFDTVIETSPNLMRSVASAAK